MAITVDFGGNVSNRLVIISEAFGGCCAPVWNGSRDTSCVSSARPAPGRSARTLGQSGSTPSKRLGTDSLEGRPPLADKIDLELHGSRILRRAGKVTFQAPLESLPDGCFVQIEGCSYLVLGDALVLGSPAAYVDKRHRPTDLVVTVLTPEPIVRCIRQGYRPQIHKSALDV